jgi:Flp pilus assembly protein TadG
LEFTFDRRYVYLQDTDNRCAEQLQRFSLARLGFSSGCSTCTSAFTFTVCIGYTNTDTDTDANTDAFGFGNTNTVTFSIGFANTYSGKPLIPDSSPKYYRHY